MLLKKDEIIIRSAETSDASILCKWWNDGKVMSHAGFPNGLGTTIEKVEKLLCNNTDNKSRIMIIEYGKKPLGEMSYRNVGNETAEIGIKICDSEKQEKGIGTIVLRMFIESLFEDYDFTRIILDTNLNNKRAQHVYEKIGFRKVKVNFDSWKNQLGELQSSVDYVLNKDEYNNIK